MGHSRPVDDALRCGAAGARLHRHPRSSEQRRLSHLLARPWLWLVRRKSAGPKGVQPGQGGAELPPCPRAVHHVPASDSDPVRHDDDAADRTAVPGLHPVTTPAALRIHPTDTVAVAIRPLAEGEEVVIDGRRVVARQNVAPGHKLALHRHGAGQKVIKYGFSIGTTTAPIETGDWVHSHNLTTGLVGLTEHHYAPTPPPRIPSAAMPAFKGYRRSSGRVGTRNEIWVLNTVGCVNHAAERIARLTTERFAGTIDGVYAFGHPFGCSQLGDDLEHTQRVLAGLMRNPNAGGVLVLGLGCESNQMEGLLEHAGDIDRHRLRFFNTQDVIDELEQGTAEVSELVAVVSRDERGECPASDLVLGHKCGGSDGFSGISANAVVGRIADRLTALGGCVLLSEVPGRFGA